MHPLLSVFIGGGLGAVARYSLCMGVDHLLLESKLRHFPFGILACNLLGCFFIGIAFGLLGPKHPLNHLLVVGFLGGFTTFSTFGKDSYQLFSQGMSFYAIGNILLSMIGGLFFVWLGIRLTANPS